jgi:hypothetical protein
MNLSLTLILLGPSCFALAQQPAAHDPAPSVNPLVRRYHEGESVVFHMRGSNRGRLNTLEYEAEADGSVKKDASGKFVVEFAWSDVTVNGSPYPLAPGSSDFRETLSLSPDYQIAIPNVSQIQPILMGPVLDLLTFYADLSLAMRQAGLKSAGDHVYFKYGAPNSWADGKHTILGEDSIDFDITLKSVDREKKIATLVVRHVPPTNPQVKLPAAWMKAPIADTPNNWVQIDKTEDGKYAAQVGKETFDVVMEVSLETGRILSATMENPVEVSERECSDAALATCEEPQRYQIMRKISIY